jgi:hypothetical protein
MTPSFVANSMVVVRQASIVMDDSAIEYGAQHLGRGDIVDRAGERIAVDDRKVGAVTRT